MRMSKLQELEAENSGLKKDNEVMFLLLLNLARKKRGFFEELDEWEDKELR